ncbi:hypothetical protein EDC04DRAFT_2614504 [Pisolithus marmoratus]|nr:hypothetical protein EDC04DRAFT_2614504 [Pisolithus marmoratus]
MQLFEMYELAVNHSNERCHAGRVTMLAMYKYCTAMKFRGPCVAQLFEIYELAINHGDERHHAGCATCMGSISPGSMCCVVVEIHELAVNHGDKKCQAGHVMCMGSVSHESPGSMCCMVVEIHELAVNNSDERVRSTAIITHDIGDRWCDMMEVDNPSDLGAKGTCCKGKMQAGNVVNGINDYSREHCDLAIDLYTDWGIEQRHAEWVMGQTMGWDGHLMELSVLNINFNPAICFDLIMH